MEQIFGSQSVAMTEVRKKYPHAKSVPVCAWDIVHNIYSDGTYSTLIAQTKYYPRETAGSFDYSYELIWQTT